MIKELQYKGYSTASSDYECSDGQLALSLNLISEDGQLKPILPPKEEIVLPADSVLMYVHETAYYKHTIYKETKIIDGVSSYRIFARYKNGDGNCNEIIISPNLNQYKELNPYKITAIGNILILLSEDSTDFYLFKDYKYNYLGNKLPEINLSFSLNGFPLLYSLYDKNKKLIELTLDENIFKDSNFGYDKTTFNEGNKKKITEYVMAAVNKFIQEQTIEKERFLFPFFVRYAYKLYDGSTTMASAPILITPTTIGQPLVFLHSYNYGNKKAEFDIFMTTAQLQYRFLKSDDFSNWADIIKSIDVYISKPIYGYKQDGDIEQFIDTSGTEKDTPYHNTFIGRMANYGKDHASNPDHHDRHQKMLIESNIVEIGYWDTSICMKSTEWLYQDVYTIYFNGGVVEKGANLEKPRFLLKMPTLPRELALEKEIDSTYLFYKVASIDPYKENLDGSEFKTLQISEDTLKSLVSRETLADDFMTHDRRIFGDCFEYNARVNTFSLKRRNFSGFLAQSMFQHIDARMSLSYVREEGLEDDDFKAVLTFHEPTKYEILTVVEEGSNRNVVRSAYTGALPMATFCNTWDVNDIDTKHKKLSWPSFFYYPNANAKKMIICNEFTDDSGNKSFKAVYSISLTQHEYLNGAFARLDFRSSRPYFEGIYKPEEINTIVEEGKNKILTSEVNNPFLFPPSYVTSVGDGEILGISTAAQALSQGQFGQFPLYAFTTDGVWALQVSDKGTFSSRQPISRDVCTNKESITQLDQSVVFATDRGIMIIEGSKTSPITDAIFTNGPFDVTSLKHIDVLHKRIGHKNDTCIPTLPFNTYMKGCRMAYDYAHQRIYVYNPEYSYAYVFSLKSKMWGMVEHNFSYSINSYPDTKIVTKDNMLLNLSSNKEDYRCGMFITRPLKLDSPNVLKTITTIIQRGHFQRGDVSTVLYGSRDIYTWHLIWSSKDHYLRGLRGTPYKYFRIAASARLNDGESIFGASVNFEPRHTNQLR